MKQKSWPVKGKGLYTASIMLNLRVVLMTSGLQNVNTVGLWSGAKKTLWDMGIMIEGAVI